MASLEPARLVALTCIASIPILCIGFDAMLQKTASLVHQKSLIIPAFVSTVFCAAVIALPTLTLSTNASKSLTVLYAKAWTSLSALAMLAFTA